MVGENVSLPLQRRLKRFDGSGPKISLLPCVPSFIIYVSVFVILDL